jgi:hypothetical protein
MKNLMLALILVALPIAAHAERVKSEDANVNVARIVNVKQLSAPGADTQISVVVHDIGGSTDMSPTQDLYLTLYRKGEMFSTDAAFRIDGIFGLDSARLRSDGRIEIKVKGVRGEQFYTDVTYVIDARRAKKDIEEVVCEDFDCDASTNFSSEISVVMK